MNDKRKKVRGSTGDPAFDGRIRQLIADWGAGDHADLCQEMVITAMRMAKDPVSEGDLKLFNRMLKELRHAAAVFRPYADRRKIAIFGSARTAPDVEEFQCALEFARRMREHGFMIITGGGDGIMGAAQLGAGREHSFGLNIRLPFEQRANETIDGDPKLVNFNYFFTRKLNFLKETDAVALFPGGFGTMDEGFEALTLMQTGKARIIPLVLLDKPDGHYWGTWMHFLCEYLLKHRLISDDDFHLFRVCETVDEAVAEVAGFYRVFHSYRWVREQLAIRINHPLKPDALGELNDEFASYLLKDKIVQQGALPEEQNEPGLLALPRIVLTPCRQNFGRLRLLINAINATSPAPATPVPPPPKN